jgi:hypothetical protein
VTGDDIVLAINQDRDSEVENPDAVGDLPDLLSAVAVRIGRVRLELVDRAVDDRQPRRKAGCPIRPLVATFAPTRRYGCRAVRDGAA